jgi:hypothetical protein
MIKRVIASNQENYLCVYTCFEQVISDYFQPLRFVSERQSVEFLTNILQSSLSLKQRYVAAELVVHLTVVDQVSATEVQNLLTTTIDHTRSQQIVDLQIDRKFKSLLIHLMMKEPSRITSRDKIILLCIFA